MRKSILLVGILVGIFVSCNDDDDDFNLTQVPPLLLAEVAPDNNAEIREFLETHFYNYEEFQSPPPDFNFRIVINPIDEDNADRIPLIQQVDSVDIDVSSFELGLPVEENDIPHRLYYLSVRPTNEEVAELKQSGACPECFPTVADSVFVRYEGQLLDGSVFDAVLNNPIWFDLAQLQDLTQGFRGFSEGLPFMRRGEGIIDNGDGTADVENFGVGMIIFPSGLGSFNRVTPSIPQYSPLIFTLQLLTTNMTDHDGDGIPSIEEDVDGNGYLYDDNADFATEFIPAANFQDPDDDGDGIPTIEEIFFEGETEIRRDSDGRPIFPDSDGDSIPDYLDIDPNE